MQNTIEYSHGDVLLVNFVLAEGTEARRRPGVVLSSEDYHRGRQYAGLLFPSVATGIIRTIKQGMMFRKPGTLSSKDMVSIEDVLRLSLGLAS